MKLSHIYPLSRSVLISFIFLSAAAAAAATIQLLSVVTSYPVYPSVIGRGLPLIQHCTLITSGKLKKPNGLVVIPYDNPTGQFINQRDLTKLASIV